MDKLFIYIGITVGGLIGSYVPVWLFNTNAFGVISIIAGSIGSVVGLWIGYKAQQNFIG